MKKKILLTGGGTGGHIYPAIAIANEIKAHISDAEICFAGTHEGLESRIVPQAGYPLKFIHSGGIERHFTLSNIKNASLATVGLWDAYRLLNNFRPDIVIGTGGYVSGPLLFLAGLKKIPILLQEQNAVLGVTNRIVQRFANCIALGDEKAKSRITGNLKRVFFTGNPVRPEFFSMNREIARRQLNLSEHEKLIIVSGGSRGARALNLASIKLHQWIEKQDDFRLLHATGSGQWENFCQLLQMSSLEIEDEKRKVVPYLENMPEILWAADFIISRAGALALAEIAVCGIPSLLVPYPYAAEDHQTANGKTFVDQGGAIMIRDRELTGDIVVQIVAEIFNDPLRLGNMKKSTEILAKPDATKEIGKLVLKLIEGVDLNDN